MLNGVLLLGSSCFTGLSQVCLGGSKLSTNHCSYPGGKLGVAVGESDRLQGLERHGGTKGERQEEPPKKC